MKQLLLSVFLFASMLSAQVATLTGRVTDSSGAVIPQVKITALATNTGISTSTETTSEGYYTLPSLTPGPYEITISKQGFSTVKQSGI